VRGSADSAEDYHRSYWGKCEGWEAAPPTSAPSDRQITDRNKAPDPTCMLPSLHRIRPHVTLLFSTGPLSPLDHALNTRLSSARRQDLHRYRVEPREEGHVVDLALGRSVLHTRLHQAVRASTRCPTTPKAGRPSSGANFRKGIFTRST
jgi:hypothetical protein